MAISFIGQTSGNQDNKTSQNLSVPTGTIDNDILILMVSMDGTVGQTTPSGWTLVAKQTCADTHTNQLFYKVASNEPSYYTLSSDSERSIAIMATYRNVSTTTVIDSYDISSISSSKDTTNIIPSFTPTTDNCLVIAFTGHANGNAGNPIVSTWPGNFTERLDNVNGPPGTGSASSAGAYADQLQTTATDVGGNIISSDSSNWGVIVFALTDGIPPVIQIDTLTSQIDIGDTNIVLHGYGFEASQGTGKVELGDNANYANCTVKTTQNIDSWSDEDIQFDAVLTGLLDGDIWAYVTNNSDDVTIGFKTHTGINSYYDDILSLANAPEIYHRFNNSYADEQGDYAANGQTSSGTFGFVEIPLTRNNTHSFKIIDKDGTIEMNDSPFTNQGTLSQRVIGGWVQFDRVHLVPSGIWEEGGGVNNIYMVVGFGNNLLGNVADSNGDPDFKVQAFSDFTLNINRPYHIAVKLICGNIFTMFVDGVEVTRTAGEIGTDTTMSSHSGDYTYGEPDSSLDTGGVDIAYPASVGTLYSDWATWSNYSNGILTDTEIRNVLFEKGARETNLIEKDTESAMQTAIDLLANTHYIDKPLPIKIERVNNGGDLNLELDGITFDNRCSMHIQFLGKSGETLTIINTNGSNCDLDMCSTPYGGTIVVINPIKLILSGLQNGTEIRILKTGTIITADSIANTSYKLSVTNNKHEYEYLYPPSGYTAVDISIIKPGYKDKFVEGLTLTDSNITLPIQQYVDRNYVE